MVKDHVRSALSAAALCLALAGAGAAQFYVNDAGQEKQEKLINFCVGGALRVFTGSCTVAKSDRNKDSISEAACARTRDALKMKLKDLYPFAQIEDYRNLTGPEFTEIMGRMDPNGVPGFFLIGEGDPKGAFITGPRRDRIYPARELCVAKYDVYGGFTSYSKYSPVSPAPASLRGLVISKTELVLDPVRAVKDSWANSCYPGVSLVYQTRTFAGRMKDDVQKLLGVLEEKKKKQALKVLKSICDMCEYYVRNGHELAALCPPNANVCTVRSVPPQGMKLVYQHYCTAIPAGMPSEDGSGPPPAR